VEAKWMLLPMLGQTILTFEVMQIARKRRLKAVNSGEVHGTYFKTMEGPPPPRYVLQGDQMILNLFETPLLFFVVAVAAMGLNLIDPILFGLGWGFVVSRVWHAYIKLTHNKIKKRAIAFAISCYIILLMWVWLVWLAFKPEGFA